MNKKTTSNIKLGLFVIAGLLFLILLLYMIGKNQNLFGSSFELKARFHNVQGLRPGNNIRYAGIQAGTVKKIRILNDTVIEVVMYVDTRMKKYIRKSATVAIGTDGLIGNKLVNISPSGETGPLVADGDILTAKKMIDTDEMLQTLGRTNEDVAVSAAEMKNTLQRISNSTAIWKILNDNTLPQNIKASLAHIRSATERADEMVSTINKLITDVKNGKGSLGAILTDSTLAKNLNESIIKIKSVGEDADTLAAELNDAIKNIRHEVTLGKGPVSALLKDSAMTGTLRKSLDNIRKGTDDFNRVMDALKNSFLFRGYFRKLEKQKEPKPAPPPQGPY